MTILETVKAMPEVESVREWRDRTYINLAAAYRSTFRGELTTKLWLRDTVLTIERGKGTMRDAYITDKRTVIDTIEAAGGTVRDV